MGGMLMASKSQITSLKHALQQELMRKKNVSGVGVGYKVSKGKKTDELCLVTLVREKMDLSALSSADRVPAEIEGVRTDVIEVGNLVAHKTRTSRWRPAPPGVSLGHYAITAGTFGAVVRDVKTGKKLILSNNHVMANSNDASPGDAILQPGAADGGKIPQDRIASLERFITIQMEGGSGGGGDNPTCSIAKFAASTLNLAAVLVGSKHRVSSYRMVSGTASATYNLIDAAVALPVSNDVISEEIIDIGRVTSTKEAELGMKVKKSGRTTATTEGEITTLDALVEVGYGGGQVARFENQIITTDMSDPGDSGSLLVTQDGEGYAAVGLLFAGSDQVTIHSRIQNVMDLLQVDFNLDASI